LVTGGAAGIGTAVSGRLADAGAEVTVAENDPLRGAGVNVAELISANPQGVANHPDHVARAVLFLVSDLAAFVNGHVLVVDGDATA
jgi:NAD(P)-dependent dehydrogenase (short-subunit alcohol dehydrogenase family)